MESEINIENLQDHVLEEIFSYIPKKRNLRLVSKRFWDIVNFSPKLMSKFTLYVNEDINNIRGRYQNIKFNNFDSSDVEFVKQSNWKQFVKNVHFDIDNELYFIQKLDWFKSILSEFDHLLDIQLVFHWSCISFHYIDYIRREEFPNIRSLKTNNLRVLSFFRNAPNLKKLDIKNASGRAYEYFIQPINWKLKELYIDYLEDSKMDTFVKFLEAQSSTLTTLKINNCSNILNDIIHKLPNLEVLHLQLSKEDYINEWLLPNDKLKELAIINTNANGGLLEQILRHYKSIEKLYIHLIWTINVEHELRLTNIKHLTVTEQSFGLLKYLRTDNLKSLTLIGVIIGKFDDVLKDILSKVEILKVEFRSNPAFLTSFPALNHLYWILTDNIGRRKSKTLLSYVLERTNLKYLSLHKYDWKISVSPEEFLIQKGHPDTIINLHDSNDDMLDETDVKIVANYRGRNYYYDSDDSDLSSDLETTDGYDS